MARAGHCGWDVTSESAGASSGATRRVWGNRSPSPESVCDRSDGESGRQAAGKRPDADRADMGFGSREAVRDRAVSGSEAEKAAAARPVGAGPIPKTPLPRLSPMDVEQANATRRPEHHDARCPAASGGKTAPFIAGRMTEVTEDRKRIIGDDLLK